MSFSHRDAVLVLTTVGLIAAGTLAQAADYHEPTALASVIKVIGSTVTPALAKDFSDESDTEGNMFASPATVLMRTQSIELAPGESMPMDLWLYIRKDTVVGVTLDYDNPASDFDKLPAPMQRALWDHLSKRVAALSKAGPGSHPNVDDKGADWTLPAAPGVVYKLDWMKDSHLFLRVLTQAFAKEFDEAEQELQNEAPAPK